MQLNLCGGALSQSCITVHCVSITVRFAECFPDLHFVKICLPKSKSWLKSYLKVNALSLNDKMKTWDLLECGMCLAKVGWHYGKNESSIFSTVLNFMHSEHLWCFFSVGLLETIYLRHQGSTVIPLWWLFLFEF
jgi:hypothetical protein